MHKDACLYAYNILFYWNRTSVSPFISFPQRGDRSIVKCFLWSMNNIKDPSYWVKKNVFFF